MPVKIRLSRGGRKDRPYYRVQVADSRAPRDGRYIELVGTFDPLATVNRSTLNKPRIDEWVKNGAQLSERVKWLYDQSNEKGELPEKVVKEKKSKKRIEAEKKAAEAQAAAEAESADA